ncbi:pancreatic triacylglycerol lipase-like protein [Sarcoptes scabiei]|uniref:Pancreatic triacylglycerol lipase-like protein n=1 Tax=Sarcoptes scabiei TaxID=52283 RepID=A0A132A023_SARSC|nr:pancreatic triacylglycerol lipase-like protein [Sarcoptes scabiei]
MNVTYPEIGTFFLQDFFHPIVRPLDLLPNSPDSIEPTFMLYTRNNPSESDIFYYNPNNILNDHFNPGRFQPNLLTKIIVHGYIDNTMLAQWMHELKDQFLNQASYNVIVVDWQKGNLPPYTQAAANSRIVGAMIGLVIRRLCQDFHLQPDRFHIIGHSLGSHTAGYAGKFLNGELGRITGLDPAGPLFEYHPEKRIRLWHTDAKYVEAIHTDAKQLIPAIGFGMEEPCGHVDFYPNGGINQPGCEQERVLSIITDGLIEGARRLVACNHQRAVDFYIESINNLVALPIAYACESYESFLDGKCSDCDDDDENGRGGKSNCAIIGTLSERLMGSKNPLKYQGKKFFMATAKRSLFFRYQYLIEIKMSRTESREQPIEGFIKMDFIDISGVEESIIFNEK